MGDFGFNQYDPLHVIKGYLEQIAVIQYLFGTRVMRFRNSCGCLLGRNPCLLMTILGLFRDFGFNQYDPFHVIMDFLEQVVIFQYSFGTRVYAFSLFSWLLVCNISVVRLHYRWPVRDFWSCQYDPFHVIKGYLMQI